MNKIIAAIVLKKVPMISNIVKYFTDPNAIAKKRTIITFLSMLASGLIAAKGLFAFVCSNVASAVSVFVCSIDIDALSKFINSAVDLLNTPGVSSAAFLASAYALIKGYITHIRK